MWEPRRFTTLWAFTACYRDIFTFFCTIKRNLGIHIGSLLLLEQCHLGRYDEPRWTANVIRLRAYDMHSEIYQQNFLEAGHGSRAWTVFVRWNAMIPLRAWMLGVYVYMCLFCVCAVLCLGRGLVTSWSLIQRVLPIVNRSGNWKEARAQKGCRAIKKNYL
jgi:hypothetical protein